ncbi:MAG: hypothetical protein NTZ68_00885 [Candidatus Dependentiae bacterium]|nr:hypothetical protein [Candidatus Dependentiae bacterium]
MELFKKVALGAFIGLCMASFTAPSEQIYNFRWYLMNVLEQHCQDLSGSTKKIGAKNPCLISLDPLIQTSLLGNILVGDDLVKKRLFCKQCKNHMTAQSVKSRAGKSKLSKKEARHYCKESYKHFKQAHGKYQSGPKLGYAARKK